MSTLHSPWLRALLQRLGDGRFHSGAALAAQFSITRSAVWQAIESLRALNIDVHAVKGRGYRLAAPLELLDAQQIQAAVPALIEQVQVELEIDSTSSELLRQASAGAVAARVCLAEQQTAGRGRRGRAWASPFAASLYLSMLWPSPLPSARLSGMSLVTGLAILRVLYAHGVTEVGLKWPNDILWRGRKLVGILLEFAGEANGPCQVVCGIGININMPASSDISQPWVDLQTILGGTIPSRNQLASDLVNELVLYYQRFERDGLLGFLDEWQRYDLCFGREIRVLQGAQALRGVASGIDAQGALLLELPDGRFQALHSGEVSVRLD